MVHLGSGAYNYKRTFEKKQLERAWFRSIDFSRQYNLFADTQKNTLFAFTIFVSEEVKEEARCKIQ